MPGGADVTKPLKSQETGELQTREFRLERVVTKILCRTVGTCPNVGGNLKSVTARRVEDRRHFMI